MTEIVKRNDAYTARYAVGEAADPYAAFANESGPGIVGRLLSCRKGDWGIGQDNAPVPPEARFLFLVPETMRGWMKWRDSRVVASDMGLVRDNFARQASLRPRRYRGERVGAKPGRHAARPLGADLSGTADRVRPAAR